MVRDARAAGGRGMRSGGGPLGGWKRLVVGAALAALLAAIPAGSATAAQRYEPGPRLARGVFLAKASKDAASVDRQASASIEPRIVGGNSTTVEEWPWQAAIAADPEFFTGDGFDRQFCGGSLVAPTIVVSAAHCFFDVLEGGHDFDPPDLFS